MTGITTAVRRDQITDQSTIRSARPVHDGLWHVELEWSHGRKSDVLAVRRHPHTPLRTGARVHAELLRIGDSVVFILT